MRNETPAPLPLTSTSTATNSALLTFEHLRRGDLAPEWVRDGILTSWELPRNAAAHLIVLSENIVFRVTANDVPLMVVRLGRPGYVDPTYVRSELLWIGALRGDSGISTPAPVSGVNGSFLQSMIDNAGSSWTAVAFEFAPGTILEEQDNVEERFPEVGAITAHLHAHARGWTTPQGFTRFTWHHQDLLGPTSRWGDWRRAALSATDRTLLERAERAALRRLEDIGVAAGAPAWYGLIHGDLRPSNVLTDGDAMTIIDFDDCGYGYYMYDLGAALTFYEHRPEAAEMAAGWIDGYRTVLPLDRDDLDAAAALSMIRRLTILGWTTTHRPDALPTDLWQEYKPGTIEVAERYLHNDRWLLP